MTKNCWIVVVRCEPMPDAPYSGTDIVTFKEKEEVLGFAGMMFGSQSTIKNVFKVSETGSVEHYNIVFNGRLELEAITKCVN